MSEHTPNNQGTQMSSGAPKVQDNEDPTAAAPRPVEYGGPKGPEPTRYGDWERNGKCVDF